LDITLDGFTPILNAILYRDGQQVHACRIEDKLLVGRRELFEPPAPAVAVGKHGHQKLIVADHDLTSIPRSFVMLEKQFGNSIRVSNIHRANSFSIAGMGVLSSNQSMMVSIPSTLILPAGYTLIIVDEQSQADESELLITDGTGLRSRPRIPFNDEESHDSNRSFSIERRDQLKNDESILGTMLNASSNTVSIEASDFLEILDFIVQSAQQPASTAEFFRGISEAVTRFIRMDRAEVVFWDNTSWERSADRIHSVIAKADHAPSASILDRALVTKQIVVYPDDNVDLTTIHSSKVLAAIACPILDERGEVLGVLYADRYSNGRDNKGSISEIEEKLIEILATAISTGMAKSKRESLVSTYQQFFSSKVVEAIQRDPKLLAGENCDVTVLFCDIRGFSRITDRIGPSSAMMWMQDTLSELSNHVLNLEGVLVDYVGDALFAMWGAPDKQPHHAFCAASTAINMMALAVKLSDRWRELIPEGFEFGIGLCTGPAQVGNTGSRQKFKYGPMGRTVNLGSRIQGLTSHWRVQTLMDEETVLRLSPDIPKRRICQARVKGMEGSITIYELISDQDQPFADLRTEYELALQKFEQREHRDAASAFGDLVKRYPQDGPSLAMLVRAVQEVANPNENFDPVWIAPSK